MASPRYDLILYGATGYTGQLTAEYLARAGFREDFTWALAGRDAVRLERLRQRLCSINPAVRDRVGIVVADSADLDSLRAMTAQGRVLLTTVGPYIQHGEALVAACIDTGTDYADLTGEPEYVDGLLERHHAAAEAARVRIVNSCGFDSIPHDFGVFYTLRQMGQRLGRPALRQSEVRVEGFVRAAGRFSGGTWHSAVTAFSRVGSYVKQRRRVPTPELSDDRSVDTLTPTLRFREEIQAWALPFPTIDPQVICRSARSQPDYGRHFHYGHYVQVRRLPKVLLGVATVAGIFALSQVPLTRNWLLRQKAPGSGPSLAQRSRGFFRVVFVAECDGLRMVTRVSGGDPGYAETAKMLAETGLCLALDRRALPRHYGVITPVLAGGAALLQRLQLADIRFEILQEQDD